MSIKLEDLIHTVCSECEWQIVARDGYYYGTVYKGSIDKMPVDVYFAVKDLYVLACGEWDCHNNGERTFNVDLTADPNSESMIVGRYKQRKEWEERQKEYQAKLNSSKENEK